LFLRQIKPRGWHADILGNNATPSKTMDRNMELAHLAIAQKAVADGERHIECQEQRVAELDRDGHDTVQALAILATFRDMQAQHVAHRDLLLKMLRQDAAKPQSATGPIFRPGYYDSAPPGKKPLSS
jgi:hypothetical protein